MIDSTYSKNEIKRRQKRKQGFLFLLIFLLILPPLNEVLGHDHSKIFRNITSKNGLSENHINCFYQDSKGFVWIGTNGGLNRYDGYEFKNYHFDPDSRSGLKSNIIQCITEDQNRNLWLGTADRGVFKMNIETEQFTYFDNGAEDPNRFMTISASEVLIDTANRIWFRGKAGIEIFPASDNDSSLTTCKVPFRGEADFSPLFSYPTKLFSDHLNRIWIGSKEGLYLSIPDPKKRNHIQLKHLPEFGQLNVFDIEGLGDAMLLAHEDGVILVEIDKNGTLISSKTVCNDFLKIIKVDNSGSLWGKGLDGLKYYHYNSESERFVLIRTYSADQENLLSIAENNITTINQDNTGILWFGTNSSGICILDPERKKINKYNGLAGSNNPDHNKMRSFYQDSQKNIWIGTAGGNIFLIPDKTASNFPENAIHKQLISAGETTNSIYAFAEGSINQKKFIWVGAGAPFNLGIIPIPERGHEKITATKLENFPHPAFKILVDSEGIVWICTYDHGLYRIFPEKKGLEYWENIIYLKDGSGLSSNITRNVFEDFEGNIWVGTSNGLDLIRKSQKLRASPEIIRFRHNPEDLNSLSHNYILPIIQDRDSSIWIGTMGGGVNKLSRDREGFYQIKRITMKDGLPDNMIKALQEDDIGDIWISSNKGLSRYNNKKNLYQYSIGTGEINNFSLQDGLQDLEFSDLSCMKTSDGELFFGGLSGFNSFYPDSIRFYQERAIPVLTELHVLNKVIEVNEELNGRIILEKNISATHSIKLLNKENSFSIKFSSIHFASPQNNKFKFILEGFDEEWVDAGGNNRIARYTKVNPGHYSFKLRASNNDFIWNPEPVVLDIIIKPPWWRSIVAFVIYLILFIVTIFFFRKFTLISYKKKNALLLEKIKEQQREEIAQVKLSIFTNISHEIRTPLTLIKGPVKKLMNNFSGLSDEKRIKYYHSIDRNASRINNLINQIMDFRKAEQGKIELAVKENDIVMFSRELLENFSDWANEKMISLDLITDKKQLKAWFDPDVLEKILNNLLSNAIKYTPDGGEIKFSIDSSNAPLLILCVTDNGIGIPGDKISYIFDLFYKTDQGYNTNSTGIGLSFVKSLVTLHHGEIKCSSQQGSGSDFCLKIPVNREAFSSDERCSVHSAQYKIREKPEFPGDGMPLHDLPVQRTKGDELKLLVIDDNPEILEFIAENMPDNFRVSVAGNGEEGLNKVFKKNPDIIVCDVMMPLMDGYTFCTRLKDNPDLCHIPLLMLTAKAENVDKIDSFARGADAYLAKPFDIEVLISNINAICKNRQILRNKFSRQLNINPGEITVNNRDEMLVFEILQLMEKNVSDPKFNTKELAKLIGKSINQLNIKLKAITGHTTGSFMKAFRLKKAAQLLELSDYTVAEITFQVGLNDLKYFRTCFKKEFGLSPSEYRTKRAAEPGITVP